MTAQSMLQTICVRPTDSLKRALEVLQNSKYGLCLVTDEQHRVLGTITDGDCRRALLRANSLDIQAREIMNSHFIMVEQSFSLEQIKTLMQVNSIEQVPIVDVNRALVDLVTAETTERGQTSVRPNPVLILAGGRGRRLQPLTNCVPKPMLPIRGRPMIERLVAQLANNKFEQIYISVNYLGDLIEKHLGDGRQFGCNIRYLREESELGTAGPLKLLAQIDPQNRNSVLVMNGDLVTTVDFGACIEFHGSRNLDMTVGITSHKIEVPFGVVNVGTNGLIKGVSEKPIKTFMINAGLYVIDPGLIALIDRSNNYPMTDLIGAAINCGKIVGAFPIHESWTDVGIPEQYFQAQLEGED